jgi:hypothetical protein
MNSNNFRIGNIALGKTCTGELVEQIVESINSDRTHGQTWIIDQPIPLTEELLVKFGFKKDKIDSTYYKDDFEICLPFFVRWKESHLSGINHVHQLQNLMFALTGEELTTK